MMKPVAKMIITDFNEFIDVIIQVRSLPSVSKNTDTRDTDMQNSVYPVYGYIIQTQKIKF